MEAVPPTNSTPISMTVQPRHAADRYPGTFPAWYAASALSPTTCPRARVLATIRRCNSLLPLWHHAGGSHVPAAKSMPVRIHIGAIDDERALGTHEVHQMRGRDVEHFVRPQCRTNAENRKPKTLAASSSNNSWRRSKSGKPSPSPVTRRFAISLCAT